MLIFQFTLPREERRQVQAQPLTLQNFNPRSHERSDHITQSFVFRFFNFNPRSHERSDDSCLHCYSQACKFQSTLPREERLVVVDTLTRNVLFQSTLPREERLTVQTAFGFQYVISIHAPTRGATGSGSNYSDDGRFQSTLPREERPMPFTFFTRFKYFNPRSHERSDSNIAQKICLFLYNTDNKYIIR